jgi:ferredoxin
MRYLADVVTLAYREEACTGCGECAEVCPRGVFVIVDGKARIIDKNLCVECGACAKNCAFSAISVKSGVGCASALINGILRGGEPECGCCGPDSKTKGCC